MSASKLWRKLEEEQNHEGRTFFCSELVAAAYKRLALLPKHISAAQYWPGAFAALRNLKFSGGAKLSGEYMIDFSIPE